jgi:hypothetical protein
MVELTRIYTVEITGIMKGKEKDIVPQDEAKVKIQNDIKEYFGADDVLVTNVQDFIREVKGNGN